MYNRNQRAEQLAQANELTQSIKLPSQVQANVLGSEVNMGVFLGSVPKLPSITYLCDNTVPIVDTTFLIGDPTTMIDAIEGGATVNPTEVQGRPDFVIPNKNFFFNVAIAYSSINYQTSSTPAQFAKRFETIICNSSGNSSNETINLASARRNTADDDKLLTITGQFLLDIHRALLISVLPAEVVTITLVPSAYTV